jgi:hypothetical protein
VNKNSIHTHTAQHKDSEGKERTANAMMPPFKTEAAAAGGDQRPTAATDPPHTLGIYFSPAAWSRRYGSDYFTASVKSFSLDAPDGPGCFICQRFVAFEIECCCGTLTWAVHRRCREWLALWERVREFIDTENDFETPTPPGKTILPSWLQGSAFLDQRRILLSVFLDSLLVQFNRGKCGLTAPIREFLGASSVRE